MKNKKIVICILITILVIGVIFGWNYYKLKNDVFIKPYELSDDAKLRIIIYLHKHYAKKVT